MASAEREVRTSRLSAVRGSALDRRILISCTQASALDRDPIETARGFLFAHLICGALPIPRGGLMPMAGGPQRVLDRALEPRPEPRSVAASSVAASLVMVRGPGRCC